MTQLSEHVHELAEVIGPRPATTDAEAEAADYIQRRFEGYDLAVERQDFECPRTDAWSFIVCDALVIGAAVLAKWASWPAFALAAIAAGLSWSEASGGWGLSRLTPKGPSQNIIGRRVPKLHRGERARRIVLVAHYDSPRSGAMFSPGMMKNLPLLGTVRRWATGLVPAVLLIGALPFARKLQPWSWYAALVLAAGLLAPLFFELQRQLAGRATDGANDNASGVAAMLGVLAETVPETDGHRPPAEPVRRDAEAAYAADVVPDEAVLEYTPSARATMTRPAPTEVFAHPDEAERPVRPARRPAPAAPAVATPAPAFEDDEIDAASYFAARAAKAASYAEDDEDEGFPDEELDSRRDLEEREPAEDAAVPAAAGRAPRRWWPFGKRRQEGARKGGVREWLGVERDFDARKEGATLGTWEHLAEEGEEEDDFGFKGGLAGPLEFDDPGFAADEASRIRHRVTSGLDRALAEKELWFVATGAADGGGWGMRAFLDEHADELRGALIIDLECVGAGTLSWVTAEDTGRRYRADRRLTSTARRVAIDSELPVEPHEYSGLPTDATRALMRRCKAMSVMAFDINDRIPGWHQPTDTAGGVAEPALELAVTFVTELIKSL